MKHQRGSNECPAADLYETSPLLGNDYRTNYHTGHPTSESEAESQSSNGSCSAKEKRQLLTTLLAPIPRIGHHTFDLEDWQPLNVVYKTSAKLVEALPAVAIALLLNLLDALSYGILLFPTGDDIFADSGPDGMSLFYISCVVSQLVCSTGSVFRGSVGSQLIEAVPFFHRMCAIVIQQMGRDNPDAVRATVVTAYAMSAIITGLTFTSLGVARLGRLVDLIPRTVLTGCIGGIGVFLLYTGVGVSARLDGDLKFSIPSLLHLFDVNVVFLWTTPLLLAVALLTVQRFFDRSWLLPACFAGITVVFYSSTTLTGTVSIPELRSFGWLFEPPGQGVPFYNLYSYYKFHLVDWRALWSTMPTQLALMFFSILHVPINVPNLAVQTQQDDVDIDRELVLHGISNTLSGCVGSVQNYLCFVNSVYFIRTGGDSRLAGYLLTAATFVLWVVNSDIIGFVPITVVATLIYMLGIELTVDALLNTFRRMHVSEYAIVVVTAFAMAFYDFVSGIAIGLGLAGLNYIITSSRMETIQAECVGPNARSTVVRQPRHREHIDTVRTQLQVIKLRGFLSFGTINHVENRIRHIINKKLPLIQPIDHLLLDCGQVSGIDFSAAEAFVRIQRAARRQNVELSIAGLSRSNGMHRMLQKVGLFDIKDAESSLERPTIYERLEDALDDYENRSILGLEWKDNIKTMEGRIYCHAVVDDAWLPDTWPLQLAALPPRKDSLDPITPLEPAELAFDLYEHYDIKEPLTLLMRALQGLSAKDVDFWLPALAYFSPRTFVTGESYVEETAVGSFCLLSSGHLHIVHHDEQGDFVERIAPQTACGELPLFNEATMSCTIFPKSDCYAWVMSKEQWAVLQLAEEDIARELLQVGINLSVKRAAAVHRYAAIHAL